MKKEKVLVVVPAYNEELNIVDTIKDIKNNTNFDYVIINDGSKDNTLKLCKSNKFNYLSVPINYGLASSIQLGFKYALYKDYDIVIQFDGDGQHDAKYLSSLVEGIKKGNDVVIGSRFFKEKKPFTMRMVGSRILSFLIKITTFKKITDPTSGMRAYGKRVIPLYANNINFPPEPDSIVFLMRNKYKVCEIQVSMRERKFGKSYLSFLNSIKYMIRMMLSILFIQIFRKEK